jgi:prepilin-type processing-associated H-X9-DG protein
MIGLCLLLGVLVVGCGSSSSSGGPWQVVGTAHNGKANFALLDGAVAWPSQVEVTIETTPSTTATTHYTVVCGTLNGADGVTISKSGPTGATPFTFLAHVPLGGPGSCLFRAGANYHASVDTTITVRQRAVPTA